MLPWQMHYRIYHWHNFDEPWACANRLRRSRANSMRSKEVAQPRAIRLLQGWAGHLAKGEGNAEP